MAPALQHGSRAWCAVLLSSMFAACTAPAASPSISLVDASGTQSTAPAGSVDDGTISVLDDARRSCSGGACAIHACVAPWSDCNDDHADGCERALGTHTDCSACGDSCAATDGSTRACTSGRCTILECPLGRGDCNADVADGCESALDTDAHCGACGVVCTASRQCRGGACIDAVVQLAAGDNHACALRASGRIDCWGSNLNGALGDGGSGSNGMPVRVTSTDRFVAIAAGGQLSCAIRDDGAMAIWGQGERGEMGDGRSGPGIVQRTPRIVPDLTGVTAIACGNQHACAVTGGVVMCWGEGSEGEIGDGGRRDRVIPAPAFEITDAVAVGVGDRYTCALHAGGTVSCWGRAYRGRLGDGNLTGNRSTPFRVIGVTGAIELAVGGMHACARVTSGGVRCWGMNRFGQLGDGTTDDSAIAVDAVIPGAVALAPGRTTPYEESDYHTCALTDDARVLCWGSASVGRLGDGSTDGVRLAPGRVHGLVDAAAVVSGPSYACALRRTGSVECWGLGPMGGYPVGGQFPTGGAVVGFP